MPMSKKQLTKKAQQDKAEAAELQKKAAKAKSSDTATQAHWQDIAKTIEKALK